MAELITIQKDELHKLHEMAEDIREKHEDLVLTIESMELIKDKKFMKEYKEARQQIKKREFADWNELKKSAIFRTYKKV